MSLLSSYILHKSDLKFAKRKGDPSQTFTASLTKVVLGGKKGKAFQRKRNEQKDRLPQEANTNQSQSERR